MFDFLIPLAGFLIALTIHEFAHAWAADQLGDPNPKLAGRLSLNPANHLDLWGTIILPLFLILSRSPLVFGWAKPVQVDIFNFKNRRRDMALVSLAGPGANLLLALISVLFFRFILVPALPARGLSVNIAIFLLFLIRANVVLAFFNLLPVHPLDGGKILVGFLPENAAAEIDLFLNRYSRVLILLLILPFGNQSLVSLILAPIVQFFLSLVFPPSLLI
ncbi:MAG: site-2 protease family protein [Candidatus Pacebacteria bacterium]|nr:site-2 protease family protein [Candidatus Paceibacterota bacterium]